MEPKIKKMAEDKAEFMKDFENKIKLIQDKTLIQKYESLKTQNEHLRN